ncbi:MAG: EF-hand domain-containing protein [Opitutaceae bacterium]|nr:EF-hand domain-containing protein [Opitutaceae bacterium]
MKTSFLFPALLAATQFVLPAAAETEPVSEHDAAIIKRYDTNKDGKLDEGEIAAVKEQMLMVDQEKRGEKIEKLKERQAEWLKEFDQDGDGKLNEAEKKTMETTLRARMAKNPHMMKRLDTDGDGKLSDLEWGTAREKLIARFMEERKK